MFLSAGIIQTAVETGLIYGLVALSLFVSFSILDVCDLSTDGCYTLGCAVGALVTLAGHPILALFASMAAGILSGFVTGLLQTTFKVPSILAGIIVNTGLYTVNLAVMGFRTNVAIFGTDTIFRLVEGLFPGEFWKEWSTLIFLLLLSVVVVLLLHAFLNTRLGLSIRATGDSPAMVRASSINPGLMVVIGLCISNAFTGLSGSLIAQYNKMSDINLGTGMVTIALASLIIGQTFSNHSIHMMWKIISVLLGSVLYRFIISIALRLNVPTEAFKLVSALIVAVAIVAPQARSIVSVRRKRAAEIRERKAANAAAIAAGQNQTVPGQVAQGQASANQADQSQAAPNQPESSLAGQNTAGSANPTGKED